MDSNIGTANYIFVKDYWQKNTNIKIYENKTLANNRCIIYASSNGIWHPNTIEKFKIDIVRKDRYEWKNWRGKYYRKQIFVRDILKEWYVNGINGSINSIDKLISFLKKETEGYSIVTAGNSAGGYLAIILGIALSAEYVLSFSGQINIWEYVSKELEYPELFLARKMDDRNKYFNIVSMIKNSDIPIFYFYASNCEQDINQYHFVSDLKNVYSFAFNTRRHGVSMYPFNLPVIVDMEKDRLLSLQSEFCSELISQRRFALKTMEHKRFWVSYLKYIFRSIPRLLMGIQQKMFYKIKGEKD